jgi:SPASM domain peptide maturase of grasp-with-spasm system
MADRSFLLFACCVPVHGARRSLICDLQRQSYRFIPNGLYEILTEHEGESVEDIKESYGHQYDAEIDSYFDFLLENELGFWCDDPTRFPPLDLTWDAPERITNAIVEVDRESEHDFPSLLDQLDELGCRALELRFYDPVEKEPLVSVLRYTEGRRLQSVDLLLPHHDWVRSAELVRLILEFPRISHVFVHGASEEHRWVDELTGQMILYVTSPLDSHLDCGCVSPAYFAVNLSLFTEARTFNSCLHRKVAIDRRGAIRNCPSMPLSFGNLQEESLAEVVGRKEFRSLWSVTKDQVDVCRDCEFRYICTDCRALVTSSDRERDKPAKCSYDPYTAIWGRGSS